MTDLETRERIEAREKSDLPRYEAPKITVMNEEEVLSSFQITQAGVTWWVA